MDLAALNQDQTLRIVCPTVHSYTKVIAIATTRLQALSAFTHSLNMNRSFNCTRELPYYYTENTKNSKHLIYTFMWPSMFR